MSRRYSARDREMAARICSIAASESNRMNSDYYTAATDLGYWVEDGGRLPHALGLAFHAWERALRDDMAVNAECDVLSPMLDAEAEALIRTGWVPS